MKKPISIIFALVAIALIASISPAQTGKGSGDGTAAIYQKNCAKCHGADGKGIESLQPPDFTSEKWQKAHTDAALNKGISIGEGAMPGFKGKFTPAQISDLVKYVRAFGPKSSMMAKPAKKK